VGPVIDYRGRFDFSLSPEDVWAEMERTDRFEDWWSWLREFSHEGDRLTPGAVLRGVVVPPLPYRLRIAVEILESQWPASVDAQVDGDLVGPAHLRIDPREGGSTVEVRWHLEMKQAPMRLAARFGRPLLQWGHDRVVEMTVAGFRRRVESAAGESPG
jgi:hypothetical protein